MHGKKQACEKNTSSRWLYKHHTRKILLIFPSLSFSYFTYISLGCAAARELLATLLLFFFPCETYLTGTLLYCTVVIDPILTVKTCGSSVFLFLFFFSTLIALYCIALRCIASRPGKNVFYTIIFSTTAERPTSS